MAAPGEEGRRRHEGRQAPALPKSQGSEAQEEPVSLDCDRGRRAHDERAASAEEKSHASVGGIAEASPQPVAQVPRKEAEDGQSSS